MKRTGIQPCPKCRKQRESLEAYCADGRKDEECYFRKSILENHMAEGEAGTREWHESLNEQRRNAGMTYIDDLGWVMS